MPMTNGGIAFCGGAMLAALMACADPSAPLNPVAQAGESGPQPARSADSLDWSASGCRLAVGVYVIPFADLQAYLPAGFTPADASGLLDLPADVGEGAALLSAYECAEHAATPGALAGAEINILVEDPLLDDEPADTNYYLAQLVLGPNSPLNNLISDGWNALAGQTQVQPGVPMTATVQTGIEEYSLTILGAAPSTLAGRSRFWHITPDGPSWFDYDIAAEVRAGALDARWGPGTLAEALAQAATASAGIAVEAFDWNARYQPPGDR